MLTPQHIWLARDPVDMRRGMDTLTRLVSEHPANCASGAAFIFCNKARSRIKVLQWDRHGVWLCVRRLHRGHFAWPRQGDTAWALTPAQFDWLVKGIDWVQVDGQDLNQWEL